MVKDPFALDHVGQQRPIAESLNGRYLKLGMPGYWVMASSVMIPIMSREGLLEQEETKVMDDIHTLFRSLQK